jgi:glycosyltransferase involved in cell wall biosynthesis
VKFSVIVPAHDEERYLGACLRSVSAAAAPYPGDVEVIVVLNRCTDGTERIAREAGARLVREDAKNLSRIRNAGAAAATGEILVSIDADSTMSANLLARADRALSSGTSIGGGVMIRFERYSLGLVLTLLLMLPLILWYRVSGGAFWCRKRDFDAVGGFDERRLSFEDVDFALRLKALGRRQGKRFGTLFRAHIVTSCRKFDRFGDWFLIRHPGMLLELKRGVGRELADKLWYEVER